MRKLALVFALFLAGCPLTEKRQEVLGAARDRVEKTGVGIAKAAEGFKAVLVELETAAKEERPPLLEPVVTATVEALQDANKNTNDAGKAIAALQDDLGVSPVAPPKTTEELDALIAQLRAIKRIFNFAKGWIQARFSGFSGGMLAGPSAGPKVAGWTTNEISASVVAIIGAIGTIGEVTRRKLARDKAERESLLRTADQAEAALNDCKAKLDDKVFGTIMSKYPAPVAHHAATKLAEAKAEAGGV
jgi:hypothetical protein